jgi:uncharacterized protein (TIRG00374 family)
MKDIKRWLPGAVISLLFIAAILYFVDLRAMLNAMRNANYTLLGLGTLLGFAWMAIRAIVWRTLLRNRASYTDVFFTVGEGYLLNAFLPFRLGEVGRAFLLSRKSDPSADSGQRLQFGEILPTIVIERATDLGFNATILLLSIPFVVGAGEARQVGVIAGVVILLGFIILYLLARYNQWAFNLFHKLSARWPTLQRIGGNFLESFFVGLGVLRDGWLFVRFLFWMTVNWALAIVSYTLILRAFFPQATLIWGMFGLGIGAFGNAIPALPGAVGTLEGAFAFAVKLLAGPGSEAGGLAVGLTVRFYNYLNSGVVGGLGLLREGQTLSGIYAQLKNFRSKAGEEDVS